MISNDVTFENGIRSQVKFKIYNLITQIICLNGRVKVRLVYSILGGP